VLKCLTYLVSLFVEEETKFGTNQKNINDLQRVKGPKGRKKPKEESVNFLATINKLNSLLDWDLNYLWLKTKKLEQEFIKCLFDIGFNLLENSKSFKNNADLKDEIFAFLQKIISKYGKELSGSMTQITARITSVLYKIEEIADPLAEFVVVYTENDSDSTFAVNILEELTTAIFNSDSSHESTGIKNCSVFLSKLSLRIPKVMFSSLGKLLGLLDWEAYQLRIAFVNIITNFVIEVLTKNIQDVEDTEMRNNYQKTKDKLLRILLRRIYDKTSFVRKEVLNCFKIMIVKNVIDTYFYEDLMSVALGRIKDVSINVRKAAMSLLEEIIKIKAIFYEIKETKGGGFMAKWDVERELNNLDKLLKENVEKSNSIKGEIKILRMKFVDENPDSNKEDINEKLTADPAFLELKDQYDKVSKYKVDHDEFVDFYEGYVSLLSSLESSVPLLTQLLGSKTQSDIVESIKLLTYLQKMNISRAVQGTKKILVLFFNKDDSVKREALEAYKTLYLKDDMGLDQRAFALIELLKDADASEEVCVEEFLSLAVRENVMSGDIYKALWKIFKMCNNTAVEKQNARAALKILRIATEHNQNILSKEEDTLKEHTLKELDSVDTDFLLINEQIKAWEKLILHQKESGPKIDEFLFSIMIKLVKQFGTENPEWNCAAEQFINSLFVIKQLKAYKKAELFLHSLIKKISSEQDDVIDQIEAEIQEREDIEIDESLFDRELKFNQYMLAQMIFVAGHIGIKMIIYIENIEKLLEKRWEKKKQKKKDARGQNEDQEEELDLIAGGGDAALEADRTFLTNVTEKTLLQKNLLSKFVPVVDKIVEHIFSKYGNLDHEKVSTFLERVAVLTYWKFILISSEYCQSRIDRLFELLSLKGFDSKVKSNILICIGDLYKRFPTILDSFHQKFFLNLSSDNSYVRRHCLRVISHLALNDMIKIRGEISDICMLLKDQDDKIRDLVKLFLHELHSKHNDTIYNLIPEAINRLSECEHFKVDDFEDIAKILVKYVEKDKQIEMLLDKLCQKLSNSQSKLTSSPNSLDRKEVRNTAYTISILNISEKHLPKLMDHYDKYKACIQKDEHVRNSFKSIPPKFKKNNDIKDLIDLMESKFSIDGTNQLPLSSESKAVAERFNDLKKRKGRRGNIAMAPAHVVVGNDQPMDLEDDEPMEVAGADTNSVNRKRKFDDISQ